MTLHRCELHAVIYFLPYLCYQEVNFGTHQMHSICIGWWQLGWALEWPKRADDIGESR